MPRSPGPHRDLCSRTSSHWRLFDCTSEFPFRGSLAPFGTPARPLPSSRVFGDLTLLQQAKDPGFPKSPEREAFVLLADPFRIFGFLASISEPLLSFSNYGPIFHVLSLRLCRLQDPRRSLFLPATWRDHA